MGDARFIEADDAASWQGQPFVQLEPQAGARPVVDHAIANKAAFVIKDSARSQPNPLAVHAAVLDRWLIVGRLARGREGAVKRDETPPRERLFKNPRDSGA